MTRNEANKQTEREKLIQRLHEKYPDGIILSNYAEALQLGAGKTPLCVYCGAPTPFMGILLADDIYWLREQTKACTCPDAVREQEKAQQEYNDKKEQEQREQHLERVKQLQKHAGLAPREIMRTFSSYIETADNKKALDTAMRYADRIIDGTISKLEKNSLYIFGSYGTGKTYLASAIANAVIDGEKRVVYTRFGELCRDVRRAYDTGSKENDGNILKKYKACRLLVLDDLGKEKFTDWSLSLLFELIDSRYRDLLPTVITANYSVEETVKKMTAHGADEAAAEAIADRIREAYFRVQISGQSWRGTGSN